MAGAKLPGCYHVWGGTGCRFRGGEFQVSGVAVKKGGDQQKEIYGGLRWWYEGGIGLSWSGLEALRVRLGSPSGHW